MTNAKRDIAFSKLAEVHMMRSRLMAAMVPASQVGILNRPSHRESYAAFNARISASRKDHRCMRRETFAQLGIRTPEQAAAKLSELSAVRNALYKTLGYQVEDDSNGYN